jgi:hypothetical protein
LILNKKGTRKMHQITCKNCNKEFDGIMGQCGGSNTCTIYRCTHCQHEETIEREPIDWSKALIGKAQDKC